MSITILDLLVHHLEHHFVHGKVHHEDHHQLDHYHHVIIVITLSDHHKKTELNSNLLK